MSKDTSHSRGCRLGLQDGEVVALLVDPRGGPELRVRALRPTAHPEVADAVDATHRELTSGLVERPCHTHEAAQVLEEVMR